MLAAGSGAVRVIRALAFVATVVLVTTVGHEWAGGSTSPVGVAALAAASWPVALLGTGRRRRFRHLFPALAAGQLVGHGVLTFFSGATTAALTCSSAAADHVHALTSGCLRVAASTTPAAMPGDSSGTTAMSGMPFMPLMPGMVGTPGGSARLSASALMLLGHAAAAVLLAMLLAHGESLLWRVVEAVVRRGTPRLPQLLPTPLLGAVRRTSSTPRHLVLVVPRRGPPAVTA
jgi:hypothetical protein